ncbi:MAG: sulfite exporter TauE/SafE family protein [Candidatus Cloacimonetes bacterium]|nr:sulfite exporter TauE/SafE family protein [Candidatus Cloacimonadota bacterium]
MNQKLILATFVISFLGSFHCLFMCSPLHHALRLFDKKQNRFVQFFLFHLGRVLTYAMLGMMCGLMGRALDFATFPGVISLLAGVVLILDFFHYNPLKNLFTKLSSTSLFEILMKSSLSSNKMILMPILGALNAFIPCGFLAMGLVTAAGSSSMVDGFLIMLSFGLGTVFALLLPFIISTKINFSFQGFSNKLALIIGILFVIQGIALISSDKNYTETLVHCFYTEGTSNSKE